MLIPFKKERINNILGFNELSLTTTKFTTTTKKTLVDPKAHIGIEIEIENFNVSENNPNTFWGPEEKIHWERVKDPSLRGHNAYEFRHRHPLHGFKLIKSINTLCNHFDKNKNTGKFSIRCSMHVHMNVLDLLLEQFIYLIILYITFERVIYKYCSNNRYNNGYCVPFFMSERELYRLAKLFESKAVVREYFNNKFINILSTFHKYAGSNLRSVVDRGSIEFRMHPGTRNKEEIIDFINIFLSLKKFSILHGNEESINNFFDDITSVGPEEVFLSVFKEDLIDKLVYEDITKDIMLGAELAQDFICSNIINHVYFDIIK